MQRILITGAGGQLGHDLVAAFADSARYEVLGTTRESMDLADRDRVLAVVCDFEPDVVIHAGAWTAVDKAESEADAAYAANAFGTRNVAEGARRVGAHVVYVSTDFVFDGTKDGPYREWDATGPTSVYGASKLAGEHEIDPGSAIVRISWVCGAHGNNFVKTMLRLANERDTWGVVDDQRGCPTFTSDVAPAIKELAIGRLPGTFHLSNSGPTTWYGFACAILEAAGHDPARITPITTADYPTPATRPANSVLDNGAWRLAGFASLDDWHAPLARMIKEIS
ncbi:MAG TPA: dTDP-4-dehydrorhamnose reductase [Acidimicrobiales bacterium]|nr:dTDP-4-dehydrorhamnose reductase [Acidimicrobiales bacterium]